MDVPFDRTVAFAVFPSPFDGAFADTDVGVAFSGAYSRRILDLRHSDRQSLADSVAYVAVAFGSRLADEVVASLDVAASVEIVSVVLVDA